MITRHNFWYFFGGVWFGVGLVFASVGTGALWRHSSLEEQLAGDGAAGSGIVLSKSVQGSANRDPIFRVEYRFRTPDGTVTEQSVKVDGETWDSLLEGEAVEVRYSLIAPHIQRISGQRPETLILGSIFAVIGGFFAISGAIVLWRAKAHRKVIASLLREGARCRAEVTAVEPGQFRINREPQWVIAYRYRDTSGRMHHAKTPPMPQDEARAWRVGDRGEVRFARNDPRLSVWVGKG